jgi:rubredoxin
MMILKSEYESKIRVLIEDKGGTLGSDWKYLNSKVKFPVTCKKGHIWNTNWDNLRYDVWCPHCAGKFVNPDLVRKFIEDKGGKLDLNWKYTRNDEKFLVQCDKGHKWETTWAVIKKEHWCPTCAIEKANEERKIKAKNSEGFIRDFIANKEGRLDLYRMRLERYAEELNLTNLKFK